MAQSDGLVEFLPQETGDALHVVVEYDSEDWQFLYVRAAVRERIEDWELQAEEILTGFRR